MKKYLILLSALFVLSACNSGNNDSKDSSTKSTVATTENTSTVSSKKVIQVKIRQPFQVQRQQRILLVQIPLTAIMGWRQSMN